MKNFSDTQDTLTAIIILLEMGGEKNWKAALISIRQQVATDPDGAFLKINTLFGGMGSFNDVVLHQNGIPLAGENDELARLRSKLFDLSH